MRLSHVTRRLKARVSRLRLEYRAAEVSRQISWDGGYSYTTDWVSPHSANWARLLAPYAGQPNVSMLEVGSWEGRSAVWFLENILTHPTAQLTCVDHFRGPSLDLRFDHNIRLSGHGARVTKLKGRSDEVLPQLSHESYDIVYVDGWHHASTVILDAAMTWFLVKPGGIVLFDDYLMNREIAQPRERPEMAIDLFLELVAGKFELLHKGYQVAVRKLAS